MPISRAGSWMDGGDHLPKLLDFAAQDGSVTEHPWSRSGVFLSSRDFLAKGSPKNGFPTMSTLTTGPRNLDVPEATNCLTETIMIGKVRHLQQRLVV